MLLSIYSVSFLDLSQGLLLSCYCRRKLCLHARRPVVEDNEVSIGHVEPREMITCILNQRM